MGWDLSIRIWIDLRHRYIQTRKEKTPEELIAEVPVIEVDGPIAICEGGTPESSHPVEYIQLNTVKDEPVVCKYCGLRYIMKKH
eukprot:1352064-Amorphochlora_amoeboformis.AAC.1